MSFYNKYLKYKNKYLQLKNLNYIQHGGELPIINDYNINLFTDPDMEKFMNPIHGLVLCYTGTVSNNYWLAKSGFIKKDVLGYNISKVIRNIPGNVQPTKKLLENLDPIDYGRFIAIKYINMKNFMPKVDLLGKDLKQLQLKNKNITKENHELLLEYIKKINSENFFPLNDDNVSTFHIILYCMCWVCNNDEGIVKYYKGIQEIFNLLEIPLELKPQIKSNSYEKQVIGIINKMNKFKIFNQEFAKNFCDSTTASTYPDCGEITALNLINLICWDGEKFDILKLKNPIDQLKEFYSVFTNFNLMINTNLQKDIFGQKLNARDAWSYLIIFFANNNLAFVKNCKYKYELNAGLSADGKNTNFFQLIKNLLQIEKWEDIKNENITEINDKTIDGIGKIEITHIKYEDITINCLPGHYYMEPIKLFKTKLDLTDLTPEQQNKINILMNYEPIKANNYFDIKISSEQLEQLFNSSKESTELKIELFKLSVTDKYNDDLRRRMQINVTSNYFNSILDIINSNKDLANKYTYLHNDFNFILKMPYITHLKSKIINKEIKEIDLSPLCKITEIGDDFLENCYYLKSINLSPLLNVTSIGNHFLLNCATLQNIDLSPLSKLTSIGGGFLSSCSGLQNINLTSLSNIRSISWNFLKGCDNLRKIDLSPLLNVTSIDSYFLAYCKNLLYVDLAPLCKITEIKKSFLSNCEKLKRINLAPLTNVKLIDSNFLAYCKSLESIDLTLLSKLESIGNYFFFYGNYQAKIIITEYQKNLLSKTENRTISSLLKIKN